MTRFLSAAAFFVLVIVLWEVGARHEWWEPLLWPPASEVGKYLGNATKDGELVTAIVTTMKRLLLGYVIGIGAGIPLGMLTARFKFVKDTLGITALGLQTLPSVCWAPLAVLWFGISETAMLFIVIMGTLWAVILATEDGISQIPPLYRKAAATMGSSGLHLWAKVLLPASLPHIVSGAKQGWAFAWRSLMAAEIYIMIAGSSSLGFLLHYGRELHAMDQVLGVMVVIIFIGVAADKVLFGPWEAFLRRRWGLHA